MYNIRTLNTIYNIINRSRTRTEKGAHRLADDAANTIRYHVARYQC